MSPSLRLWLATHQMQARQPKTWSDRSGMDMRHPGTRAVAGGRSNRHCVRPGKASGVDTALRQQIYLIHPLAQASSVTTGRAPSLMAGCSVLAWKDVHASQCQLGRDGMSRCVAQPGRMTGS